MEDSWAAPAKKRKPGNNFNYKLPFTANCNFKQVENNENTWMYKPKFIQKQVGIEIKYNLN